MNVSLQQRFSASSTVLLSVAVVALVALQNNNIEYLTEDGYPSAIVLLCRSVTTLTLSTVVGRWQGHSLWPTNWRTQRLRLINSGVALYLFLLSFQYLSATTVGVLQRLDIPILIILTSIGNRQFGQRGRLAIIIILGVLGFVSLSRHVDEPLLGFAIALTAVFLLSVSFILIKRSVEQENGFVMMNITCLSSIGVSLLSLAITGDTGWHGQHQDIGLLLLSGVLQFTQYCCLVALYRRLPIERAQFPTVLGAISTMILEMLLEQKFFAPIHIICIVVLTALIGWISFTKTTAQEPEVEEITEA